MGMKQRASQGRHNGKMPLGYRIVEMPGPSLKNRDTKIEIVEEEAINVRKIFEWYSSGRGYKSIANKLITKGTQQNWVILSPFVQ